VNQPETPAPPARSRRVGTIVKLLVGLAIGAGFGYLFLRGADLALLGNAIESVDPVLFALAMVIAVSGFWVRGMRWRCYLAPIKDVSTRSAFEILMIGYFCSTIFPGRIGDIVVRPAMMSRDEGIPVATSLATVAVERLFDLIAVLTFFAIYLAFFARVDLGEYLAVAPYFGWMLLAGCAYGVRLLVGLRHHQARCMAVLERIVRPLPTRFREAFLRQMGGFVEGLNLFRDRRNAMLSMIYTVVAWVTVAVSMWLVTRSLGLDLVRPVDSFLLLGVGALGVAIPAPGGVGSFHYLMAGGLTGLGVATKELAQAAAILMWALTIVPVLLLGIAALLRRGVRLSDIGATRA